MKRIALYVFAGVAVTGALLGAGAVRRGFSAREEPTAMEAMAARTARRLAVPRSVRALKNPFPTSPDGLSEARANWAQNCAFCHGATGDGQTEVGQNLYPKPPDLRASATQSQTDGELYTTIQNGIRLTGMPAWGVVRDDDRDRWNLVGLIRRMPFLTKEEIDDIERQMPGAVPSPPNAVNNDTKHGDKKHAAGE